MFEGVIKVRVGGIQQIKKIEMQNGVENVLHHNVENLQK